MSVNTKCLTNIPTSTFQSLYKGLTFPGQCYSLNQQCQHLFGPQSIYCNGVSLYLIRSKLHLTIYYYFQSYTKNGQVLNNDLAICTTLYCKTNPNVNLCATGGNNAFGK